MLSRINKVREIIKKQKCDAVLVTDQNNVSYFTGFTGLSTGEREGFFLITKRGAYLLTFPTYFGLYKAGGNGFVTLNITFNKKLSRHLNEIVNKEKIKLVGFEDENLTVSELLSLQKKVKTCWRKVGSLISDLRQIKDKQELINIKEAARIADLAFDYIKGKIKKGLTEKKLALDLEFFLKKNSNGVAFSPIVAFDQNTSIPHYLPTDNVTLTTRNLILLDFGAKINGYCSDMTRIVFLGGPTNEQVKVYNLVAEAQKRALNSLRAKALGNEVDQKIRKFITSKGFPEYPHGLGHGVGLAVHENPKLKFNQKFVLDENMVVTVEPGIYLQGKFGIRIEDLVVLKKNEVEIISKSPKEMVII